MAKNQGVLLFFLKFFGKNVGFLVDLTGVFCGFWGICMIFGGSGGVGDG